MNLSRTRLWRGVLGGTNLGTAGNMMVGLVSVGVGVWAIEWQSSGSDESLVTVSGAFLILFGLYRAIIAMVNIGA